MTQRPFHHFSRYHAHVYFDQDSVEQASSLCRQAGDLFAVQVGRIHRRPVGPHPRWSCQLAFDRSQFEPLIAWLEANRGDLSVLVHPLTGNDLDYHTTHASWLGDAVTLHLEALGAVRGGAARQPLAGASVASRPEGTEPFNGEWEA